MKNIKQITFNFAEEGPGRGSEDNKKEYNFNCLDFFLFSVFLVDVMGGKIQSTKKNCIKMEKEETRAHRKSARSALITERTLGLRQSCTTSRECSIRKDKGRKSESRKTNRRKTKPYCTD